MNKKNLTHFEKRLLEERARVMKELGYYDESFNASLQSSDGDLSSYSFHMDPLSGQRTRRLRGAFGG